VIAGIEPFFPTQFQYLAVDALDIPGETLDLDHSTVFLENALKESSTKVLVHWYTRVFFFACLNSPARVPVHLACVADPDPPPSSSPTS
jgi:hypothetical protein